MSDFSKLFGGNGEPPSAGPLREGLPYVEAPEGQQPIELRRLEVRALVSGLYAETNQTMEFYNPNGRPLEGSLVFPMPDGAVVSGYALDVEGRMVDGVVVPKKEARRILEAEVRKGVDPGLVEQVQGNVYRTRIYPIPARGSRTIRITYVSDLNVEGSSAGYHLPLAHAGDVEVDLRVEVVQSPVAPVISGGVGNLSLKRWQERWVAEAKLPRGVVGEDLQVRLPGLPERFTSVEKMDEGAFFCASALLPEVPSGQAYSPSRVGVAWDASGSRDDVERDLALLRGLLERWERVTVDLLVFRDVPQPPVTFEVEGGRSEGLFAHLEKLPFDGGTDLTGLDLSTPPNEDCEGWLLFSDGLGTIRRGLPKLGGLRVDTINSHAQSDSALLEHIARQTGGAFINLLRTKAPAAVEQIAKHRPALRLASARACDDVHTRVSQGRLMVVGRLLEPIGAIELVDATGRTHSLSVEAGDHSPQSNILARAWAGMEVRVLELDAQGNKDRMIELGRRYGLVTPGSSLLVLETLEQYIEYDIEPPKTSAQMHARWKASREGDKRECKEREDKQIESVLTMWETRVSWWETDFRGSWATAGAPVSPPPRSQGVMTGSAGAIPPAPESAPPPSMARALMAAAPMEPAPFHAMECEAMDFAVGGAPAAKKAKQSTSASASMSIQPWSPDTPYLRAMKRAAETSAEASYEVYLRERSSYARSPSFYLDCGDFLINADHREEGLRALSNLLELGIDDAALMRMYAWRLGQAGALDAAVEILERVLSDRDDEPQSHRDLALMLGERWEREGDPDDALRAMELLYDVILRKWDRFPDIEIIALMELNRLVHMARQREVERPERIDARLVRLLDLDVRISMSWDADLTDVDLHVYEPTGEHAYYGHNKTAIGGLVSRDFTQGYGPEEYVLRRAYPGTYDIKAHYYGSSQQDICGACTVIVKVFTNYGRDDEEKQVLTLRLDKPSDQVTVGEITIGGEARQPEPPPEMDVDPERFNQLKVGMSIDEVTALVGQPGSIAGGSPLLMAYHLKDGLEVVVKLDPMLVSVEVRSGDAVIEIVG